MDEDNVEEEDSKRHNHTDQKPTTKVKVIYYSFLLVLLAILVGLLYLIGYDNIRSILIFLGLILGIFLLVFNLGYFCYKLPYFQSYKDNGPFFLPGKHTLGYVLLGSQILLLIGGILSVIGGTLWFLELLINNWYWVLMLGCVFWFLPKMWDNGKFRNSNLFYVTCKWLISIWIVILFVMIFPHKYIFEISLIDGIFDWIFGG